MGVHTGGAGTGAGGKPREAQEGPFYLLEGPILFVLKEETGSVCDLDRVLGQSGR